MAEAALNMTESEDVHTEYLDIEARSNHITYLLRVRCYMGSVKNKPMKPETLKLLQDNHVELMHFKTFTEAIVGLDKPRRSDANKMAQREGLVSYWRCLKDKLNENIETLSKESRLLQNAKGPDCKSVTVILADLEVATAIFKRKLECSSGTGRINFLAFTLGPDPCAATSLEC